MGDLVYGRAWWTRGPVSVCPVLNELRGNGVCREGHKREERPDLPVSLLMVLHVLR